MPGDEEKGYEGVTDAIPRHRKWLQMAAERVEKRVIDAAKSSSRSFSRDELASVRDVNAIPGEDNLSLLELVLTSDHQGSNTVNLMQNLTVLLDSPRVNLLQRPGAYLASKLGIDDSNAPISFLTAIMKHPKPMVRGMAGRVVERQIADGQLFQGKNSCLADAIACKEDDLAKKIFKAAVEMHYLLSHPRLEQSQVYSLVAHCLAQGDLHLAKKALCLPLSDGPLTKHRAIKLAARAFNSGASVELQQSFFQSLNQLVDMRDELPLIQVISTQLAKENWRSRDINKLLVSAADKLHGLKQLAAMTTYLAECPAKGGAEKVRQALQEIKRNPSRCRQKFEAAMLTDKPSLRLFGRSSLTAREKLANRFGVGAGASVNLSAAARRRSRSNESLDEYTISRHIK